MIIDRVGLCGIALSSGGVCWVQGDVPRPRPSRPLGLGRGLSRPFGLEQRLSRSFGLGQRLSRPVGRESLFFACAKKSNQKKAHPVLAPSAPAALRVRKAGRNFCKGRPCPLQKRRASMRAALRVVSAGLAAAVWGPESKQQQQQQQQRELTPRRCWREGECLFGVVRRVPVGQRRCLSVVRPVRCSAQCGARCARRCLSC
ncbi:hypothetical protein C8F00_2662 [Xanthomonas vasicola]